MSKLNITWADGSAWSYDDVPGIISAQVLGYAIEIQPVREHHAHPPIAFNVLYRQAACATSRVVALECANRAAAQEAAERWLSNEIAGMRPSGLQMLVSADSTSASNAFFTMGLGYAMQFADALVPLLTPDARVEVSPCSTKEGLSGLYFESLHNGAGVKVMRCSKPGLVVMFWGTREELESPWERDPSYFTLDEIGHYAQVAADAYFNCSAANSVEPDETRAPAKV